MKALKEKRISLRSLWRRGLVILSLFALVFASCSDSDDGGAAATSGGPKPYSIEVITNPTDSSYMGLPVELNGLKVLVRYTDGTVRVETDTTKFTTEPRWATGGYLSGGQVSGVAGIQSAGAYYGLRNYYLNYVEAGLAFQTKINLQNDDAVIPLYRGTGTIARPVDPVTGKETGVYFVSDGLQITGINTRKDKELKVDDTPSFGGIALEGNYRKDNQKGDFTGTGTKKVIDLTPDMDWRIIPYYDGGDPKKSGSGGIYITVGRNYLAPDSELFKPYGLGKDKSGLPNDTVPLDIGVTAVSPLDKVHHVIGLDIETAPTLDPFFYWQDDNVVNDISPWLGRVRNTAMLKVTYSNDSSRVVGIPELEWENQVWVNKPAAPQTTQPGLSSTVVNPAESLDKFWRPFTMAGILETAKLLGTADPSLIYTKIKNPQIGFYYRGEWAFLSKPVFTKLARLEAVPKAGGDQITVDLKPQDNDHQSVDADAFGKLVTVKAWFTAYSDPDLEQDFTVGFWGSGDVTDITIAGEGAPTKADKYSMDFGKADTIYGTTSKGWGVASTAKSGATKAVKFNYASPTVSFTTAGSQITGTKKSTSLVVEWLNVPKAP